MADIKEKLVELLADYYIATGVAPVSPGIADHLIANGVTIQQWISVEERLPEQHTEVLLHYKSGKIKTEQRLYQQGFLLEGLYGEVTHWMPLPEPPKGE